MGNKTDNNQGEFGLCCFSGKTFGVMNAHAIYSMQISISDILLLGYKISNFQGE